MHYSRYLVGGLGFAVATAALLLGLHVSATAWSPADRVPHEINRVLKSDRLPGSPTGASNTTGRTPEIGLAAKSLGVPTMLEGCEAAVSSIVKTALSKVAARCLS